MKNRNSPEGIIKAMEILAEATRPYQAAVEALKQSAEQFAELSDPQISKFGVMDNALTRGFFDKSLEKSISVLLAPYHELAGARETIKALGRSFEGLIKPDVYASTSTSFCKFL